jgi:hypothetical protein
VLQIFSDEPYASMVSLSWALAGGILWLIAGTLGAGTASGLKMTGAGAMTGIVFANLMASDQIRRKSVHAGILLVVCSIGGALGYVFDVAYLMITHWPEWLRVLVLGAGLGACYGGVCGAIKSFNNYRSDHYHG